MVPVLASSDPCSAVMIKGAIRVSETMCLALNIKVEPNRGKIMVNKPIRVGFIGLNPASHWGATAHIPALQYLADQFEVVGVANTTYESSRRAAEAFGLPYAFSSASELVQSPEIDLVVVTVKVPHHFQLVSAALDAGKHVYCEWPLGNGLEEACALADLAARKGVVAVAGTQARMAVEIQYLQKLIKDGFVGKVLSTTVLGSAGSWGAQTSSDYAYMFDSTNGATIQSIPLAHTLAGLMDVLGPIERASTIFLRQSSSVEIVDTGKVQDRTSPDQVMVQGSLVSGAAVSIHYRGGETQGTNFLWEINGSSGVLQVTAGSGHAQIAQLVIKGANGNATELVEIKPPANEYAPWPESSMVRNIARLYACIADDIRLSTRTAPSFEDAVTLHRVVNAIEQSAKLGEAVSLN